MTSRNLPMFLSIFFAKKHLEELGGKERRFKRPFTPCLRSFIEVITDPYLYIFITIVGAHLASWDLVIFMSKFPQDVAQQAEANFTSDAQSTFSQPQSMLGLSLIGAELWGLLILVQRRRKSYW